MDIDIDSLRADLIDYYGTAMSSNPIAMMDLINVENASDSEIISIALQNGFDLEDYQMFNNRTR